MLVAVEAAIRDRESAWTTEREFLATIAELVSALVVITLKVNGAKKVGKPLHIRRPWESTPDRPKMLTMGEFARKARGGGRG
jgi:hypothetical protein